MKTTTFRYTLMKKLVFRVILAIATVGILLTFATTAFARPARAVAGNAPSKAHAGGTLFVGWHEDGDAMLGEWGIAEKKLLKKQKVRSHTTLSDVRVARSSDRVVMIASGESSLDVVSFDLDLKERKAINIPSPSSSGLPTVLDANDAFILAGEWEERTPRKPPVSKGPDQVIQPHHALSLKLIDASTFKVVGSRVFTGDHLLMPFFAFSEQRVVRLGTGENASSAYVALPEEERAIIMKVALPTLATQNEHAISNLTLSRASASLELVEQSKFLLVQTVDELHLLSGGTLKPLGSSKSKINSSSFVYDAGRRTLVTEAMAPSTIGAIPILENRTERGAAVPGATLVVAFGRHIAVSHDEETDALTVTVLR